MRARLKDSAVVEIRPGSYFSDEKTNIEFISTGCRLMDLAIGGGWPLGRIANIVGDKSTGKTLLAIEAFVNFSRKYPSGKMRYAESEAAFEQSYAKALGMPVDQIKFNDEEQDFLTTEDFYNDLLSFLDNLQGEPGLYCLDTLDALSSEDEQERDFGEGSFNTQKSKDMSKLFRMLTRKIEKTNCCLIIISQERDKIGVTFGKKSTRSGGRALDFYASQVVWLARREILKKIRKKVERAYGVSIRFNCEKNKISLPFRTGDFDILFGYGIDDIGASVDWLAQVKRADEVLGDEAPSDFLERISHLEGSEYEAACATVSEGVSRIWRDIEIDFLPTRKKY